MKRLIEGPIRNSLILYYEWWKEGVPVLLTIYSEYMWRNNLCHIPYTRQRKGVMPFCRPIWRNTCHVLCLYTCIYAMLWSMTRGWLCQTAVEDVCQCHGEGRITWTYGKEVLPRAYLRTDTAWRREVLITITHTIQGTMISRNIPAWKEGRRGIQWILCLVANDIEKANSDEPGRYSGRNDHRRTLIMRIPVLWWIWAKARLAAK